MMQLSLIDYLHNQGALFPADYGGNPSTPSADREGVPGSHHEQSAQSATLPRADFDGETYSRSRDFTRLNKQISSVYQIMRDGEWRTLAQLAGLVGAPQQSVSARLRDLRKEKFGAHVVERRHVDLGLYEYRLAVPQ